MNAGGAAHAPTFSVTYRWQCPACRVEAVTHAPRDVPYHVCPRLRFLSVPLVRHGTKAKIELVERGDYVGREHVQLDPERGRPVASIVTTRDNGQDTVVLAPSATAKGDL